MGSKEQPVQETAAQQHADSSRSSGTTQVATTPKSGSVDTAENHEKVRRAADFRALWTRRLIVGAAILIWAILFYFFFMALARVGAALTLIFAGALLAYLIYPIVLFLERFIPHVIAIVIVFAMLLAVLCLLVASVGQAVFGQIAALPGLISWLQSRDGQQQIHGILNNLSKVGISSNQINATLNQIFVQLQHFLYGLIPFWQGTFNVLIDIIVVATVAVYFIQSGPRMIHWMREQSFFSYQKEVNFLLDEIDRAIGGYFRGLFIVGAIAGVLTWLVLWLLGVPYAVLLGLIVFVSNFIPVIGGYIGGPLCILMAIPQGWVTVLIVAVFVFLLQGVFLGQILSPRILGKAVGIHPILAIFALFAGSELFGIVGGILAVPVVGVIQHIVVAAWSKRKQLHPEEIVQELIP
ncbi:AI-2E family transporter [Dictyobacter kobayashii]|uniref:AI-2E family transporter n=1 Tax=Dictyobacter kobayashii TaxID=2014872 RepID=A0A402ABN5_9CHLR|nr:AI-2E family transporter [Dictyobacter kobayashii]GCE16514.1 AI-2E family transporter [Dictyobacter kobayashii]